MNAHSTSLLSVFDGWAGYNTSIVHAVGLLNAAQLACKPAPEMRTLGEVVRHIALGRLSWFLHMGAPGSAELAAAIPQWETDSDGNRWVVEDALPITEDAGELTRWLEDSWAMIDCTLAEWTVDDLRERYLHRWNGQQWNVSRQWTLFRILAHDIHHGGEVSLMLGLQGIDAFELGVLGGHIVLPPLAEPDASLRREDSPV